MARRYIPVGVLAVLVVLLQLIIGAAGRNYYLTQLTMTAYYAVVAMGLCLLMGFAGQISLGHAGFFAIGGYTSAALTTLDLSHLAGKPFAVFLAKARILVPRQDIYGAEFVSFSPWVSLIVAVAITAAIAALIGIPVLRLRGHYLAMATMGFGIIVYRIVLGTAAFGAADGIAEVPPLRLLPGLSVNGRIAMRVENYYVAWALVVLVSALAVNLVRSRTGRALRSIHGNEQAAAALGVNSARAKLATFVFSAIVASIAGVFLTHYNAGIGPSETSLTKSIRYVSIVAVGGMSNIWGVLVAGSVLNFFSLRGVFGTYDDAVFGGILIVVMLFAPQGILNLPGTRTVMALVRGKLERRRASHLRDTGGDP